MNRLLAAVLAVLFALAWLVAVTGCASTSGTKQTPAQSYESTQPDYRGGFEWKKYSPPGL